MTYHDYERLLLGADEFETAEAYVAECGGSVDAGTLRLLPLIWRMGRDGIRGIRKAAGMSQAVFARKYGIPVRSVENWELPETSAQHRDCPSYVFRLLGYAVLSDLEGENAEEEV